LHRVLERGGERLKALVGGSGGCDIEQALFCGSQNLHGLGFDAMLVAVIDQIGPDLDQLPPQMRIIDDSRVVGGVQDRHHRGGEPGEITRPADFRERAVLVEIILQRDRIGDLSARANPADRGVDALMGRVMKMFSEEIFLDPLVGLVVDQDGAEEGLFSLDVARRRAVGVEIRWHRRKGERADCFHPAIIAGMSARL
jgi:hypothetical protein